MSVSGSILESRLDLLRDAAWFALFALEHGERDARSVCDVLPINTTPKSKRNLVHKVLRQLRFEGLVHTRLETTEERDRRGAKFTCDIHSLTADGRRVLEEAKADIEPLFEGGAR